ncbi:MAG: hypothetical protein MJ102_00620 [Clostridia bacterium]|nr:hypothetical protein [Clostridia bacterium]
MEASVSEIAQKIYSSGLVRSPIDADSLETIEKYYNGTTDLSTTEKMLANLEYTVSSIHETAERNRMQTESAAEDTAALLRSLTDYWYSKGSLRDFTFSFSDEICDMLRSTFSRVSEEISSYINLIADGSVNVADCAARMRACVSSASELSSEARLAELAYTVQENKNAARTRSRSLHLRARATALECEKIIHSYLGFTRICAGSIAMINRSLTGASKALRINSETDEKFNVISPISAAGELDSAINALETNDYKFK